jgi:cob(I)alamin adenosyltransferase
MAAMKSGDNDLVILDEICIAVYTGALSEDDAMKLVEERPENVELIFTGREATQRMIDAADIVTDMKEIKHYYTQGVTSRKGIDC